MEHTLQVLVLIAAGVRAFGVQETAEAEKQLSAAAEQLSWAKSPLQWLAKSLRATNYYHARDYDHAEAALNETEAALGDNAARYPGVVIRLYWTRGLVNLSMG